MSTDIDQDQLLDWLSRTANRDRMAFQRLYDASAPQLFAIAYRMLGERSLAEDVLQDAYVKIWHRAGDYHQQRGTVMVWMTSILRYRAIDLLRRRKGPVLPSDSATEYEDDSSLPDELSEHWQDQTLLRSCLERLSQTQQRCISLAFFGGLTHHQVSQRLALPLGTIKSRIRRSLARLRECMEL